MGAIRVLMFGWEFPPKSTGGLGTACFGLTKGLVNAGVQVNFVLPASDEFQSHVNILPAFKKMSEGNISFRTIRSNLTPYITSQEYGQSLGKHLSSSPGFHSFQQIYGSNLFEEVERYSEEAVRIAIEEFQKNRFDIIHCHDWLTFKAGINAKQSTGVPLIIHIHATEFDRTADQGVNQYVYEIEKQGMLLADKIIAVSNYTKLRIIRHYGIPPEKIVVIHNAVDTADSREHFQESFPIKKHEKIVLYLGRLTIQKGPDYFLYAAKKVLDYEKAKANKKMPSESIKFIIAGTGDMEHLMIEKAAELDISQNVLFAGHLSGVQVDQAYKMADLYVMPSVSEPFGITPLEAARNKTPVIISKQSGVSEVLKHCFKVDFWDVNELANKIIVLLKYKELHQEISHNSYNEVKKFSWNITAEKCIDLYNRLIDTEKIEVHY